jgi:hypothetical protein
LHIAPIVSVGIIELCIIILHKKVLFNIF